MQGKPFESELEFLADACQGDPLVQTAVLSFPEGNALKVTLLCMLCCAATVMLCCHAAPYSSAVLSCPEGNTLKVSLLCMLCCALLLPCCAVLLRRRCLKARLLFMLCCALLLPCCAVLPRMHCQGHSPGEPALHAVLCSRTPLLCCHAQKASL